MVIMEYLVNISKRRAFWSLNEDILKITVLTTNTPHSSRKIRRIRACTHQSPQWKHDQYAVSSEDQYAVLEISYDEVQPKSKNDMPHRDKYTTYLPLYQYARMRIQQRLARDLPCNTECRGDHYRSHMSHKAYHRRLVNGSSCDGIDMVIKDLDLELKVDAIMRDFLYPSRWKQLSKETSSKILPCGDGSC
ncbi:hypothetical protein Tco_1475146 [Tanacetum coccineum]